MFLFAAVVLVGGCSRVADLPRVAFVTQLAGDETDPAMSPDGKSICFAWRNGNGVVNLYSKPLEGEGGVLQLTADPEIEASPRWSPDGRRIAYLRFADAEDETTSVRVMDAWGGNEREVAIIRQEQNLSGTLDWTRDGEALVVDGLLRVAVDDGTKTALGISGAQPAVSPDGRAVVYRREGAIFVSSLGGRESERLLAKEGSRPVWSADGKEVIYSFEGKLWRVEGATGGVLGELALDEVRMTDVRPAPGVRNTPFVYTRRSEKTVVYKMDVESLESTRVVEGDWPDISADGESIVYTNGGGEIWICDREGRDARPVHTRRGEAVLEPFLGDSAKNVLFGAAGNDYTLHRETGTVVKGSVAQRRRLFEKSKLPRIDFLAPRPMGMTADGRTIVYARYEWPGWDIRKIENHR